MQLMFLVMEKGIYIYVYRVGNMTADLPSYHFCLFVHNIPMYDPKADTDLRKNDGFGMTTLPPQKNKKRISCVTLKKKSAAIRIY